MGLEFNWLHCFFRDTGGRSNPGSDQLESRNRRAKRDVYGAESIQIFKTNKAATLRMFQNQLKVKEAEIQEDTYNQFREYLEYPPYVSRKGMEALS